MEMEERLNDVVLQGLQDLNTYEPGTKEYQAAHDMVKDLVRAKLDCQKYDADLELERQRLENEELKAEADKKERKWQFWIKTGAETLLGISSLVLYGTWLYKGFKFEETGSIASATFKNLIGNLKPRR